MLKLAIAQDPNTPSSVRFYRTTGPVSFLEKQYPGFRVDYKDARYFVPNPTSYEMHAFSYDIVLIERPWTVAAFEIAQTCKSQGVIVWIDLDDNLLQIPDYNVSQDYFAMEQNMKMAQQIISTADLITVATKHLKRLYSGLNKNVRVIPNAWCDFRFPLPPLKDPSRPVRMAWRGANKHSGDLYEVRGPMSAALNDPAFDWKFYGFRPHFLDVKRKDYRQFSGLFSYLQDFILSGTDYLVVPLVVNDFNRSKSNCSWIEATQAGAVTVAPMGLPEFDQPGVIRYKDARHLKTIFDRIKKGEYDKRERVQASRKALTAGFKLSELNELRKDALEAFFKVEKKEKGKLKLQK